MALEATGEIRQFDELLVSPTVAHLNGEDPVKRTWSENGTRRSMTKGAKAMVAACMFPEPTEATERGRGKKAPVTGGFPGVDNRRLAEARTVIAFAPDLVDDVKRGVTSLADAYDKALKAKQQLLDRLT